jgi:hypothetical protein
MTTLQWIGLMLGVLIVLTRLPMVIWPEAARRFLLRLLDRGGPRIMRGMGVFFWIVAAAILLTVLPPWSLLEQVMLALAALFSVGGVAWVLFPGACRQFAEQILDDAPLIRAAATVAVALGAWLISLSLSA